MDKAHSSVILACLPSCKNISNTHTHPGVIVFCAHIHITTKGEKQYNTCNIMTLSEYSRLKQRVKICVGSSDNHAQLLAELKEKFKDKINSPRRLEKINTISLLMEVLELRETLSEDNVNPLRMISQLLPNAGELTMMITQYEATHVPREYKNYYEPEKIQARISSRPVDAVPNTLPFGQMSSEKKQRILQTVEYEIGKSWIDLARSLGISERDINKIDHQCKSLSSKARTLLGVYLRFKSDPDKWFFDLCEALDKSRRKDLSKSITKIVTMNI